jgi:hypothetical protein
MALHALSIVQHSVLYLQKAVLRVDAIISAVCSMVVVRTLLLQYVSTMHVA